MVISGPDSSNGSTAISAPMWMVEQELTKLRRNVERELITNLHDKLLFQFTKARPEDHVLVPSPKKSLRSSATAASYASSAQPELPSIPDDPACYLEVDVAWRSETRVGGANDYQDVVLFGSTESLKDDQTDDVPRFTTPAEEKIALWQRPVQRARTAELERERRVPSHETKDTESSELGPNSASSYASASAEMVPVVTTPLWRRSATIVNLMSAVSNNMQSSDSFWRRMDTMQHKSLIQRIVHSDGFDYFMSVILVLNAVCIGLRVDWEASNLGKDDLTEFIWLDRLFCIAFLSELFLRLWVFKLRFYTMTGWQWAYFDTVIVSIQVAEEILIVAQGSASIDLGFLKMLKMGRLLRMIRMVRLLPELKSIVILIMASMSSFVWTCVLLLLLVYMLSVYMVMMAIDVLEESNSIVESESRDLLFQYWGSLGSAILSVYWSVTGGQDWAVVIGPLNEQTGTQFHNVVFCMFIAFATMVLMNLVTGVFVEGAQRLTKEDRDRELAKLAHKVFRLVDDDCSEEITREEFDRHLRNGHMDNFMNAVDLPRSAVRNLFELLDEDGDHVINVGEFVDGCLRLKGAPRAVDVSQLLSENRQLAKKQKEWFMAIIRHIERSHAEVQQVTQLAQTGQLWEVKPSLTTTIEDV